MRTEADIRWARRQAASQRRRDLRAQAVAYKGGKCELCGYSKCPSAFDFHHVDPREKDFSISDRMTTFEAIRKELDKCVLLCATCHREVHDGWHPNLLVYEDSEPRGQYNDIVEDDLSYEDEREILDCLSLVGVQAGEQPPETDVPGSAPR